MKKLKKWWIDTFYEDREETSWWLRKKQLFEKRNAEIIRITGKGALTSKRSYDKNNIYEYNIHLTFFIKQNNYFYIEEKITPYQFRIKNGNVTDHKEVPRIDVTDEGTNDFNRPQYTFHKQDENERFSYNRHAAVQYAERWWNDYNPEYETFTVDCTNFVSQCLRAGGAPMRGQPDRNKGWWYTGSNWSYSWSVAHSLRWYLSGSTIGLKGNEKEKANELLPGDIICYDFQGDGRWDHTTIVVTHDAEGMPLVNAHTDNSRHRYWSYEDSTAWTPNIQYKFFQIG